MASSIASKEDSAAHLAELGISELATRFTDLGISAYADVAFAVSDANNSAKIEEELQAANEKADQRRQTLAEKTSKGIGIAGGHWR